MEAFHATKGQPGCEPHAVSVRCGKICPSYALRRRGGAGRRYLVHDEHIPQEEYLEKLASSTFCLTPLVNSAPGWYVCAVRVETRDIPGKVWDWLGWKLRNAME